MHSLNRGACCSNGPRRSISDLLLLISASVLGASTAAGQSPNNVGQWSAVMTWPSEAIHAHLLPTGQVFFWDKRKGADNNHCQLWDPTTNTISPAPNPAANIFCAGEAFLSDGRLLVTGGHIANYVGLVDAYTYSPSSNSWTRLPDMNNGRWYPTATTLPNGDILVVAGEIDTRQGMNPEPEVWQTTSNSWRNLSSAHLVQPFYPFMFVAPNGKVFCAGPAQATRYLDTAGTGAWSLIANSRYGIRNWGSAVMYDDGKVLLMGGTQCGAYASNCTTFPTNTAEIIDLNSPTPAWKYTGSMTGNRKLHNATPLPDGKVLVTGGSRGSENPNSNSSNPAYASELWDPATGTWSTMASLTVFRGYHSVALLLPDGRVLSAGGDFGGASAEIYSPPYLFKGTRPTISSAPASVASGQSFFIATPDAASIANVTMIALGSVTHGFNMGQRICRPSFSPGSGGINVIAPSNRNSMPAGHYMLFILNGNGIPSVAKILQVGGSAPTPTPTTTPTPTSTPKPTPTPTPAGPQLAGLTVVTAPSGATVASFTNGYSYNPLGNLSVRADPDSGVASVVFKLDGATLRTESMVPYSVAGDNNGSYTAWKPVAGNHTLLATPYSASGGQGTAGPPISITFAVISGGTPTPTPTPTPTSTPSETPTPTVAPTLTPLPTETPLPTP